MLINRLFAVLLSVAALVAGSTGFSGASPIGVTVLPRLGGQSPVGTTTLHLVDAARPDPFKPERSRELMVSVFYPAAQIDKYPRAHYASTVLIPELEKRFGIELPGLLTNSYSGPPALPGSAYPVVLFTPGAGVTRVLGTGLAEDLASRGYVVVTIDHTYEAPVVEFPGGRFAQFAPMPAFDKETRHRYAAARMLDTQLVLNSLTGLAHGDNPDAEHRDLPSGLDRALDLDRIGMIGHSLGGFTAVETMHDDRRIDAAIDLDGQIGIDEDFGRAATEGVDRPVLVLTSQQIAEVGDAVPSLDAFWQHGTGWKRQLMLRDSAHYDFTDMPALVPEFARPATKQYIGPIPADRATTLVRTYVAAMFDKFLRDRSGTVLDQPPTDPEMVVDR
ncbi:alpha/beta hydrolase family protein [Nocardia sp. NPDC051321]|uniref:alpha/beta hydrolase family protein n=1 Tax=Nocardia sp. NPDC051321 TaxID=3364323 RepID=UPI0037ADE887